MDFIESSVLKEFGCQCACIPVGGMRVHGACVYEERFKSRKNKIYHFVVSVFYLLKKRGKLPSLK